jgi:hypothetical protein
MTLQQGGLATVRRLARFVVLLSTLALLGLLVGTAPAMAAEAPACPEGKAAVTGFQVLVNGTVSQPGLNPLAPGDHVKVTFTVADGCSQVEVSLASYQAPDGDFANNKTSQTLSDSDTGFFDAGEHSLEVDVATCFHQTDFAVGAVIQDLGRPEYYGPRLIDSATGGTGCVETSPSPSPTGSVEATSSPTVPPTGDASPTSGVHGATTGDLPAAGRGTELATGLVAGLMVLTGIAVLAETRRRSMLAMAVSSPRSPAPRGGAAAPIQARPAPVAAVAEVAPALEPAPLKVEVVEAARAEDIEPEDSRGRQLAIAGLTLALAAVGLGVLLRRRGSS